MKPKFPLLLAGLVLVLGVTGCQTAPEKSPMAQGLSQQADMKGPFDRPGFRVEASDGRLWVLKPGQEKSGEHVALIGAGPQGMTVRAVDRDTALEYLAAKPGFQVEAKDGRLWVLKPGQEKSGNHVARIGVGPLGSTVRAVDAETMEAYLAAQP
ncbi:hypothetical protein [Ectothiorhodospira shaposhnikovii]|uniref:hypothetical protein n=1 Tax=Ectothiorhodospira shaposhnikovii TaxID=1054 RepID=UPI001EE9A453|nr:hypothetical protein [Ectothiorhodospira shaposhnikovii]MCG5513853.1 hypothetical protein [Ectothiorhodospira shaposhnikovii]